jgi:hypothetical protein
VSGPCCAEADCANEALYVHVMVTPSVTKSGRARFRRQGPPAKASKRYFCFAHAVHREERGEFSEGSVRRL